LPTNGHENDGVKISQYSTVRYLEQLSSLFRYFVSYSGKNIGLMIGDLFYLETMISKIDEAKSTANKRVL
jgi:hypothetical protein